ncbi:UTP--glucose-1-phosphate uridylyltransferase [Cellulomonas sp. C5510]|uniref:UTP--glucose-1-phosphate uridylyltransferase n=1 Tax=Cellulomonas sp. C5510 TaxID=2871170 RepID=UPI001C9439F3|nr:UTP--glucose-1-phosphate uridylyltransferase [Cellulomonas sp. C5510]QZN85599.1 UTP--glucose-1-phosphate uridylyltransferase [Cellulomonas sp. C5510]
MSDSGLRQAQDTMTAAGVDPTAVEVFTHYYRELEAGATGLIPEDTIEPLLDPPALADVTVAPEAAREAFARTAVIKLNGGLGTSMGMDRAKSLLPVRDGRSFLDLTVEQVRRARAAHGVRLPLVLMNSFRTRDDSLAALARHEDVAVDGLPLDFLQNQEPKLRTDDLTPVRWPADPTLEWCPPGHGDLYTALLASGVLRALLDAGFRYASVSNSDNLGAAPDPVIAGWFAASGAPYAAEVCRRTAADRKGGHLAVRKSDGRLILRDTAQTPPDEMDYFTDEHRHPYFHTNNLWFDLEQLAAALESRGPVLGLPLIRNVKTVDPTDPGSPEVFQIETAMGAAIEVFEGATAIAVGRERFLPVKTTNDLLVIRSDAYELAEDATLRLAVDRAPLVDLDPDVYKTVGRFEERFAHGAPSLRRARSLTVRGDWTFGADVVATGDAEVTADGAPGEIPAGTVLGAETDER